MRLRSWAPIGAFGWLAAFTFVVSILKGVRFPNLFAATHSLLNYEYGFIKRGLVGTAIDAVDWPFLYTYHFMILWGGFLLVVNAVLLWQMLQKLTGSDEPLNRYTAIVFSTSVSVLFLAHTIGYADHILLLGLLLLLRIPTFALRFSASCFVVPLLFLVHELTLLLVLPVLLASFVVESDARLRRRDIALLVSLALAGLGLSVLLSSALISDEQAQAMTQSLAERADFNLRPGVLLLIQKSAGSNISEMFKMWLQPGGHYGWLHQWMLNATLVAGPSFAFLQWASFRLLQRRGWRPAPSALVLSAAWAPLALNLIAWDTQRWWTLALMSSFVVFFLISASTKTPAEGVLAPPTVSLKAVFILLIVLNWFSSIELFDDYKVKPFPFVAHAEYIKDWIDGKVELTKPPAW